MTFSRAHARRWGLVLLSTAATLFGCAKAFRQPPRATVAPAEAEQRLGELWADPGDVSSLDLFHGAGGEALMPRPGASFRYVAEDKKGFSPGWDVADEQGTEWSVKLGPEAQSEVVASRILWAMGYRQPPVYYVSNWNLVGGPRPGRGEAGRFRVEPRGTRDAGPWSWESNPFADTQAFRGLLVLMRVINNWDLLDDNNAIYEFEAPRDGHGRWFAVRDLGASFGRTQSLSRRSGTRNDVEDYERQGFIEKVDAEGRVEFDQLGKWHRGLFGGLTTEDVRWTCERLSRLRPQQWSDAFRAAGYDAETARRFIREVQERIGEGRSLGARGPAASWSPADLVDGRVRGGSSR